MFPAIWDTLNIQGHTKDSVAIGDIGKSRNPALLPDGCG
jgi:hypothetical protein